MARYFEDIKTPASVGDLKGIPLAQGLGYDILCLSGWAVNRHASALLKFVNAAGMILVMMRNKDGVELSAAGFQQLQHRRSVTRIDCHNMPLVFDNPDIISFKSAQRIDSGSHDIPWVLNGFLRSFILTKTYSALENELTAWLATPQAFVAMQWLQERVDAQVSQIFGYAAAQFALGEADLLGSSHISDKLYLVGSEQSQAPRHKNIIICQYADQLPIESDSLDLLILPFVLNLTTDSASLLKEAERVLVHDGRLIITGFNPYSLWALRSRRSGYLPGGRPDLTLKSVRRVLTENSFEIDRGEFGCYEPAFKDPKRLQRWQFMNKAGNRWWPACGAIYLIRASKKTASLTLVGPALPKSKTRSSKTRAKVAVTSSPSTRTTTEL